MKMKMIEDNFFANFSLPNKNKYLWRGETKG